MIFVCATGTCSWPSAFLYNYINELTKINLSDGAKLTLYADDVLLFRIINSQDDLVTLLSKLGVGPEQTSHPGQT